MVTWSMTIFPCSLTSFVVRGRCAWIFSNSLSFSVDFSITFAILKDLLSPGIDMDHGLESRNVLGAPPFPARRCRPPSDRCEASLPRMNVPSSQSARGNDGHGRAGGRVPSAARAGADRDRMPDRVAM